MHPRLRFVAPLLLLSMRLAAEPTVIEIWPEGVPGLRRDAGAPVVNNDIISNVHTPTLTIYPAPAGTANGTGVVVCPGGGYSVLAADHEGVQIARWFNSLGVSAFVLHYRLREYGHPAPLRDVLRAIRTVRDRAGDFGVKPDRIGVLGFSAGGHLASTAATLYQAPEGRMGTEIDQVSARPDFALLIYPVISLQDPFAHAGSRECLLGPHPTSDLINRLSTDMQVTPDTPPVFLVHSVDDNVVPVENALGLFAALRAQRVPVEMHLFEAGGHGYGQRPQVPAGAAWPALAAAWMRLHGWLPAR